MKVLLYVCCLLIFTSCLTERPGSRNFTSTSVVSAATISSANYGKTVYPLTKKYCSSCHGSEIGEGPYQFPEDNDTQHNIVMRKQLVDINDVSNSVLVQRLRLSHNCWSNCEENAQEMERAIERWVPFLDQDLLAPEGYKTGEAFFSGGEDAPAINGGTARRLTFDLTNIVGSPVTISVVIEVEDEPFNPTQRRVYIRDIVLSPSADDIVIQDVKVLIETKAVGGNTFSFISDVISPSSPDSKKQLSQGAEAVTVVDAPISDPRVEIVLKKLRVY